MAGKHERNDIAIAQKAINLARGLSSADRSVAAAILDHFNKKTGQCDPSNERLATLLGIDQATVRRATADLAGKHGFFIKRSHGGKSCRASYTPIWSAFRAIVEDWDRRMKDGSGPESKGEDRAEMRGSEMPTTVQNCAPNSAELRAKQCETALQTHYKNPSKEPITPKPRSEYAAETSETLTRGPQDLSSRLQLSETSQGLLKRESAAAKPPGYLARERAATAGCSKSDAAWMAAQRRIDTAVACADNDWRRDMWLHIDPDQMDHAIRSEIRRRGEGIASLQAAVRLARLASTQTGAVH